MTEAQSDQQYNALLEACTSNDLSRFESLLDDASIAEVALASPVKPCGLTTRPILNLSDFLEGAAKAGHSDIVEKVLAFAQRNNIAYDKLIDRCSAVAAIEGTNSLEVFRVFVKVWPESAKLDMGLTQDPLSYSIAKRQVELVKLLLDNGADPNRACAAYKGPGYYLRMSVRVSTNLEDMEALLQHGAQIKHSGAIQEAARLGRVDALQLLLNYGADVNERLPKDVGFLERKKRYQHASETPLHVAVLNNKVEIMRWLLTHGADAGIEDLQGRTAEMIARDLGKDEMIHYSEIGVNEFIRSSFKNTTYVSSASNKDETIVPTTITRRISQP